jgi:hypothetical protein
LLHELCRGQGRIEGFRAFCGWEDEKQIPPLRCGMTTKKTKAKAKANPPPTARGDTNAEALSGLSFGDGGAEGGDAAGLDGAVAAGETFDGIGEELLGTGQRGGFVPGGEVGKRKEPGGEAADGEMAHADEGVAGVEGAVALVEEGEVARDVAGRFDGTEGADELAFGDEFRGPGLDAGDAAFDFGFGFGGCEGLVGWSPEEGQAAGVGDELDVGGAEFCEEGVNGADVVHVSVGEENASDGCAEGVGGGEDVVVSAGEAGVDEGEAVGLAHEVTVDEAEAGELNGVGGDLSGFHRLDWMLETSAMQRFSEQMVCRSFLCEFERRLRDFIERGVAGPLLPGGSAAFA